MKVIGLIGGMSWESTVPDDELCLGRIEDSSRAAYKGVIERLVAAGAQGIILGCTEIGLLIGPDDAPVPLFDTTSLHARTAERALTS